jgi:hypothetical protein
MCPRAGALRRSDFEAMKEDSITGLAALALEK